MDDLTVVQEFRSGAPEADRARLAPGRRRLLDTARQGRRGYALRHDWRFAVIGATTAVALAAVVGVRVADDSGWGAADRGAVAPADPARLSAATVLNRAADAAAKAPAPHPANGQWTYTQTVEIVRTNGVTSSPEKHEQWRRYRDPALDLDKTMGDASPLRTYQLLASLPADRSAALRQIGAFYRDKQGTKSPSATDEQLGSQLLGTLVSAYPAPPRGLSRVYRMLAATPGLTTERTIDAAGRDVIAVHPAKDDPRSALRTETLYDATTYVYAGTRHIAAREVPDMNANDPGAPRDPWHKGQLISSEAVVRQALVGHQDQRP